VNQFQTAVPWLRVEVIREFSADLPANRRQLRPKSREIIHASGKTPDAARWSAFDADISPMIGKSAAEFKRLVRPGHIIGSVVVAGTASDGG
jgi:hypothetical protein